ncbi:MAG: phage tail protein [Candidatus Spyradocola sp.]|jgi:phage tail-like protein
MAIQQQWTKGVRNHYYQSFRFKVEVDGIFSAAFARVYGIGMRVETAPYRLGTDASTSTTDIPGLTSYDHVTLERGVVGDYDMLDWILSVCSDGNRPTGVNMRRQVTLTILRPDGTDGPRWFLGDALPVSYRMGDFDGRSDEVLMESLELSCGSISREINETNAYWKEKDMQSKGGDRG